MKKLFCILLALILIVGCFSGCNKKKPSSGSSSSAPKATQPVVILPTDKEVEAQLRLEAYPETSVLMTLVGNAVTFSDFSVKKDTVSFTLSAPHIGHDLIAWYDGIQDLEDGQLEATVARLLEAAEPTGSTFTLSYSYLDDTIVFHYTNEYLNAAGCGIREYYNHVYRAVVEEMGAAS